MDGGEGAAAMCGRGPHCWAQPGLGLVAAGTAEPCWVGRVRGPGLRRSPRCHRPHRRPGGARRRDDAGQEFVGSCRAQPSGDISCHSFPRPSPGGIRVLKTPVVRGMGVLAESLTLGIRALRMSADYSLEGQTAAEPGRGPPRERRSRLLWAGRNWRSPSPSRSGGGGALHRHPFRGGEVLRGHVQ